MIGATNAHVIEPVFSPGAEVLVDSYVQPSVYCYLNGHEFVLYHAYINFKNTEYNKKKTLLGSKPEDCNGRRGEGRE